MIVFLAVLGAAIVGLVVGLWTRGLLVTPTVRHDRDLMTRRLLAEQRIDEITRLTLTAMRQAVRQAGRDSRSE